MDSVSTTQKTVIAVRYRQPIVVDICVAYFIIYHLWCNVTQIYSLSIKIVLPKIFLVKEAQITFNQYYKNSLYRPRISKSSQKRKSNSSSFDIHSSSSTISICIRLFSWRFALLASKVHFRFARLSIENLVFSEDHRITVAPITCHMRRLEKLSLSLYLKECHLSVSILYLHYLLLNYSCWRGNNY